MTNILEVIWEDIAVDSIGFDCGCLLQRQRVGRNGLRRGLVGLDCWERTRGAAVGGGGFGAPDRGFAVIPGVCGLWVLLALVEAVQAVHRHQTNQREVPQLTRQMSRGAP